MGLIRVGLFEGFKGEDTLLIDVDYDGLHGLIAWLRQVTSSAHEVGLSVCPDVNVQMGLEVNVLCVAHDAGLLKISERNFVWQRSEEGWMEIIDKLEAMRVGACHQYLDGPRDDVQVVASIGEYGNEWSRPHRS